MISSRSLLPKKLWLTFKKHFFFSKWLTQKKLSSQILKFVWWKFYLGLEGLIDFLNFQHDMKDHVTFMGSHKNVGLTIIDFKRSIMPHDSADAPIPMEGPCQVCNSGLDISIKNLYYSQPQLWNETTFPNFQIL